MSGLRRRRRKSGDEEDEQTYTSGSEVPPPPTYEEAVSKGLELQASNVNNDTPTNNVTNDDEGDTAPPDNNDSDDDDDGIRSSASEYSDNVDNHSESAVASPSESDMQEMEQAGASGGEEIHLDAGRPSKRSLDKLKERGLNLYKSQRDGRNDEDDIGSDMEMLSIHGDVGNEDVQIEVDAASIQSTHLDGDEGTTMGAGVTDGLDVGRYSPRASTIGGSVQEFEVVDGDPEANRTTRRRRRREYDYDVGFMYLPFLREIINFIVRRVQRTKDKWPDYSCQKRLIIIFSILFVIGLVLLASLLPASFVYVDYDKLGIVYNRVTGHTDVDRVYESGCYVMAPQHEMKLFPATAHFVSLPMSIFNRYGLTIGLDISFQYFLRPSELKYLYRKYDDKYDHVITIKAESTIKNAAVDFTLEEYRFNRTYVEGELFKSVRKALSGDCCHYDEDFSFPKRYGNVSASCNSSALCSQGLHVDLLFFQMGQLTIPDQVMEHYLKQITLQIEHETEFHIQEKKVQEKLTSLSVQNIENQAKEIRQRAQAQKFKIKTEAEAAKYRDVEKSRAMSLKYWYGNLSITEEDDKTSLFFLHTLKEVKKNLVAFTYDYDKNIASSP